MKVVYRWWAALVFAAVPLQIAFAGYGAFYVVDKADGPRRRSRTTRSTTGFNPHSGSATW